MAAGATGSYTLSRVGPRRMVGWGFVLTAASVLLLTLMGQHDRPVLLTAGFVLLGFGLQSTLFGAYESMLSEVPAERAGGAAAIGETSYQLGAGLGIALLGSVMNAAYAPGLSRLHEEGVPAAAGSAASHSLGEAYQVAGRLGGPMGDLLRDTARHAFVDGLHLTLLVSAGLLRVMDCCPEVKDAGRESAAVVPEQAAVPEQDVPGRVKGPERAVVPEQATGSGIAGSGLRREARPAPAQEARERGAALPARREPAEATGSGRAAR